MKNKTALYKSIALSLVFALAYIQVIQFTHQAHTAHSSIEQLEERSRLTGNSDISCLICYFLQHNHVEHFYLSNHSPFLFYQPKATALDTPNALEDLLSFISIRNNKSPPPAPSFS